MNYIFVGEFKLKLRSLKLKPQQTNPVFYPSRFCTFFCYYLYSIIPTDFLFLLLVRVLQILLFLLLVRVINKNTKPLKHSSCASGATINLSSNNFSVKPSCCWYWVVMAFTVVPPVPDWH